jgi:muramoyltetrapeptide carboxypeptidase
MPSASPSARFKPLALRPGDTVAIVATASNIKGESLEAGSQALRDFGYNPFYADSILERDLYFAGSVKRRAHELEQMFLRPEVRAIVCARGGYGSNYLLHAINLEVIKSHPKIFVGYSDVTTLLTYFADSAGLVTFHGPMVTKDFAHSGGVDPNSWKAALEGQANWTVGSQSGVKPLLEGQAEGILYGGCLSMLAASLGTPFEIHTEDTILFLEDVAAKPFQIDRMLMQLKLAGKLEKVRGVIFGEMLDCSQSSNQDYTLEQVVVRVLRDLHIPLAFGLRSGHVSGGNTTLPFGVRAALAVDQSTVTLRILESATRSEASQGMGKNTKAQEGSA